MSAPAKKGFFKRLFGADEVPAATDQARRADAAPLAEPDSALAPDRPMPAAIESAAAAPVPSAETAPAPAAEASWWQRLKGGLSRTSNSLGDGIAAVFVKRKLDDETLDALEDVLIQADLGVETTVRVVEALAQGRYDREISDALVKRVLADEVEKVLAPIALPLVVDSTRRPFVVLVVGVNGTGKTTTIGKLAAKLRREGRTVVIAAGDTFRAAAIEQLQIWGERVGAPVIARAPGSDAAGLAFDALKEARERGTDVLLVDTAGRLQNKVELMAELDKMIRVMKKLDSGAPHAVLLVLDATTGQNAVAQVDIFKERAGVTGLVMTKLDGTARGGILAAIAAKHRLPVHFVGVGEGVDDLAPFEPREFARAIAGLER